MAEIRENDFLQNEISYLKGMLRAYENVLIKNNLIDEKDRTQQ